MTPGIFIAIQTSGTELRTQNSRLLRFVHNPLGALSPEPRALSLELQPFVHSPSGTASPTNCISFRAFRDVAIPGRSL